MDGCPPRRLAFTMLGTLGELSLFALVFSDFLIEGAHRQTSVKGCRYLRILVFSDPNPKEISVFKFPSY
jgi:hypothetical protein